MSPDAAWAHYPPRHIRRFYLLEQRRLFRARQFEAACAGHKLEEPSWMYDREEGDSGATVGRQIANAGYRQMKEKLAASARRRAAAEPAEPAQTIPIVPEVIDGER